MRFYSVILGTILGVSFLTGAGMAPFARADEYHNPAVAGQDTAGYWIDRGGLMATYGNYPEAIKAYNKALALDPDADAAYYNLALAYDETGDVEQAQTAINRAISIEPENGRYLYARAWLLLRAYGPQKAQADFRKAAELGDPDAMDYLQGKGIKPLPGS